MILNTLDILEQVGLPIGDLSDRRQEMTALATLAVAGVKHSLREAKDYAAKAPIKTRDIIEYINEFFEENISRGSYDNIRRRYLVLQVEFGCIVNAALYPRKATNDPTRGYALTPQFAELLRSYGKLNWEKALNEYLAVRAKEQRTARSFGNANNIDVKLNDELKLALSPGTHNDLQKLIVEEFIPRFGMAAELLYIGDTSNKLLYVKENILKEVGFYKLGHEELPDVVAFSREKNLLFLIEAVYSTGSMSEVRVARLKRQLTACTAIPIFISAFLDRKSFRRFVAEIAWETEVWIAEEPNHLIHFNGYKFLEIHNE